MDWSPLWISIATSVSATIFTLVLGLAAAAWRESRSGPAMALVDGIFLLPLVLPPTVVGFVLLLLFGRNGPLGKLFFEFGATIVFSWPATVIAATVVAFPLMYLTARAALEQVEPAFAAGSSNPRRFGMARVSRDSAATRMARSSRRNDSFVCEGARRIRRHAHVGGKHPRENRDNSYRNLFCGGSERNAASRNVVLD